MTHVNFNLSPNFITQATLAAAEIDKPLGEKYMAELRKLRADLEKRNQQVAEYRKLLAETVKQFRAKGHDNTARDIERRGRAI